MTDPRMPAPAYDAASLVDLPRFWTGLSQQAEDLLKVHAAAPAEVHYLSSIRHWVLIQMAIAMHFEHDADETRPRLTPKNLLEALSGTGIASRNTVQAFLRELTRVQLTDLPRKETIRQHAPRVSGKSEKLMYLYIDIHLRALDLIDDGGRSLFLQNNPSFLSIVHPHFARLTCLSPAWYDPPEAVKCFTGSASGSSILHDLVLATRFRDRDPDGRYPIGAVSTAEMARRYQVSTAHIGRMLSNVHKLGIMGWERPGRRGAAWLSADLRRSYLIWQAEKLAALSVAFHEASLVFNRAS